MTWTNIPNADVAIGAPLSTALMTALRDNTEAIAEQPSGAIYNQAMWHPYNGVEIGDGNDGVYYDNAVDGNVSSVDSPEFEDGYEYAAYMDGVAMGGNLQGRFQRSSDDGWSTARVLMSGVSGRVSGYVYVPFARASTRAHMMQAVLADSNGAPDNREAAGNDTVDFAVKALRLQTTTGNFTTGTIKLLRRRSIL